MTKRLVLLVGCLCLALLTNLSFRVPTAVDAQVQPPCLTGLGPAFTLGVDKNIQLPGGGVLRDGDLFYLGAANGVQFTTQSPGARFFNITDNSTAEFGLNPGYAGTTSLGFAASAPSATSTAISCNDSFWDINFSLAGTGATAGDVITLYFRQANGTGRRDIVSFTVQPDNASVRVTGALAGIDLSAIGHTPTAIGTIIPYEEPAGAAGRRTRLITVALPMDGSVPDCNQLVVEVRRAAGVGTTTVALVNLVVTRMGSPVTGRGLQTGIMGQYPTGLKCPVACPACDTIRCEVKVCFIDPCDWCNRINGPPRSGKRYEVKIPNVNSGQPIIIAPFAPVPAIVNRALGCGTVVIGVYTDLVAEYVAAQLSFQDQVSFWWIRAMNEKLGCHVVFPMAMPNMPAMPPSLPTTLSNGLTLTVNSTIQDLFNATEWAAVRGTLEDQRKLLAIYKQLDRCKKD